MDDKKRYKEDNKWSKINSKTFYKIINRILFIENCTGFLCKIPSHDEFKLLPVLIINNHIIHKKYFQKYKIF